MSKTERSSDRTTLSVEDLLKLKRAERPTAEFWVEFDADLQQKQLQALVRPSFGGRFWELLTYPFALRSLTSFATFAGGVAAIVFLFFVVPTTVQVVEVAESGFEIKEEVVEVASAPVAVVEESVAVASVAVKEQEVESETVVRLESAFFVVDALHPGERTVEAFRTVANPETWTGGRFDSDAYAVNTLTTSRKVRTTRQLIEF